MPGDLSSVIELDSQTRVTKPVHAIGSERSAATPLQRFRSNSAWQSGGEWPRIRAYEIQSVIGSGGMGIVYKAIHRELRRTVAIKMLRGAALADPEYRERFAAEAQAVARLQHSNIIQVFEIGMVDADISDRDHNPFIALEYVEGGSLSRLCDRPQPPRYAAEIIEKLARAVYTAHQLGVIHRDLKPANVLMTNDGEPKIADFGLAKQVGQERTRSDRYVTQAGMVMGTPEYMSPEQTMGNPPAPGVDIYALGVILYELLTARVPFQAATPMETMALARNQEPVSPRRLQPGVPRDLETICLKCLEKEAGRRYASAAELANDLQCFREERTIVARRASGVERVGRWCRRNPLVAASLTLVVGVFLAAFVLVSRSYWHAEAARQKEEQQRIVSERNEKAERWERFRADIIAVASAHEVHDVEAADRLLDAVQPEFRNWEWYHYHSRLDAARHVIHSPNDSIGHAWLSPDGRRGWLVGDQSTFRIWDLAERKLIGAYDTRKYEGAVYSPDCRQVAYFRADHSLVLRDIDSDRDVSVLAESEREQPGLRFSVDSQRVLAISQRDGVRIWDANDGRLLRQLSPPRAGALSIDVSPDARRACYRADDDKRLFLWDFETGSEIEIPPHRRDLVGIWFSPNGDRLLTVEDYRSNIVRLWRTGDGKLLGEMKGHANAVLTYAFSPDGTRIATGSRDQTVRLWDGADGKLVAILRGHRGAVSQVRFSPDGKRLISGSEDKTVRLWDANDGRELSALHGHTGEVISVTYSADGKEIISASRDGTIRIWDPHAIEVGGILQGHSTYVYSVAFHPDGERIASAGWDGTVRLWDATTGRQRAVLEHGKDTLVSSVAFDPAGRYLASRDRESIRLWEVDSYKEIHRWPVAADSWRDTRLAFSPDGRLLACGSYGGIIRLWNVNSHAEVAALPSGGEIRDLAFSPDGRWLAESGDRTTRIWDLSSRSIVKVLDGHSDCVYCVAYSRDGLLLATGSTDGTVRLWDTTSWELISVLKHGPKVYGVAFSKDGSRLACACSDNSIRFWDTTSHQEVAALRGHTDYVHFVAFSPDGTRLASASGDCTVRIWDTMRPQDRVAAARK